MFSSLSGISLYTAGLEGRNPVCIECSLLFQGYSGIQLVWTAGTQSVLNVPFSFRDILVYSRSGQQEPSLYDHRETRRFKFLMYLPWGWEELETPFLYQVHLKFYNVLSIIKCLHFKCNSTDNIIFSTKYRRFHHERFSKVKMIKRDNGHTWIYKNLWTNSQF